MLSLTTKGFNQKLFNFHSNSLIRPLVAMANPSAYVSSPPFSTSSPVNTPIKRVGTHNGSFHCDEALGCFMIRLTDKFSNAQIIRTRDPKVLEDLDAVLDVGGVYDPSNDRYDHHQKGFEEVFGHGFNTKLSSAGLVYKHFGKEIIAKELQLDEAHPDVHRLFLAVYKNFMEAIDAIDNGINQYDTEKPPRYVNNTHLSSRVGKLNLDWIEPDQSAEKENEAFQRAMTLAGSEFLDCGLHLYKTMLESVRFYVKSWLPARSIVMECLAARYHIDPSGEIMVLKQFCPVMPPVQKGRGKCKGKTDGHSVRELFSALSSLDIWKLHLFELEEEMKIEPLIKYVLYEDDRGKQWRVQAVGVSPDRFESRRPLPAQWRGLRDDELSKEAGIPDCVFVHMSGFIGGNKSYEGALAMARAALKL
ncbi:hypothetical protein Patl1_17426 [Pistacia atlantica]|uniref:Uncharacterized protein n=1 Tax=Pistacia atlantica TaxID=434234 RepID=A0ACC1BZS0_9ROSI|nr:hypothetical protein Patl1_17426 [Pistacia atlantica]